MMWEKTEKILSWVREHRGLAAIFAVLFLVAVGSAWSAYRFRSDAIQAKQEIKEKEEAATALKREGEIQYQAWKEKLGATERNLADTRREIRGLKEKLGKIEEERRALWVPPAIDNLAARFDRAIEELR